MNTGRHCNIDLTAPRDEQIDKRADIQTDTHTNEQPDKGIDIPTDKVIDRQAVRDPKRRTVRQ